MSESLYNKYRPTKLSDLKGQDVLKNALRNAVLSNNVHHAYLFIGPRGVGKTTTARILAMMINCEKGMTDEPCGICKNCKSIINNNSSDVIEIDAATSGKIENIRDIRKTVSLAPINLRTRVWIIDEAHQIKVDAANALLKTLEEPSDNVVFVLCTTEEHKIMTTIKSRCQQHSLELVKNEDIIDRLKYVCKQENVEIKDDKVYDLIARSAKGGMRDALNYLEKVITVCQNGDEDEISLAKVAEILGDISAGVVGVAEWIINGQNRNLLLFNIKYLKTQESVFKFIESLTTYFHGMLLYKVLNDEKFVFLAPKEINSIKNNADKLTVPKVINVLEKISKSLQTMSYNPNPQLLLDNLLIGLSLYINSK